MGKFIPLSLSFAGLALLAGCGSDPVQPAPVVIVPPPPPQVIAAPPATQSPAAVQTVALRPGFGRIQTLTAAPTASAGGSAPGAMQRLGIRMEDGTMQYVDTTATGLSVGDRVELTSEGYIRRHPQS
jgi:hypothetical protein